jgi:hypothetical protein
MAALLVQWAFDESKPGATGPWHYFQAPSGNKDLLTRAAWAKRRSEPPGAKMQSPAFGVLFRLG